MRLLLITLALLAYASSASAASVTCYGHVFVDVNGNGVQDSFELNAQGQVFYANGDSGAPAVSNAQGNYALVFSDAGAAGNNYTIVVPAGGVLTTPPATRPALTLPPGTDPCVLNATGLMNVPSTVLNTGQVLMLSVFGGLLGAMWLTGVGFVIYYRYIMVPPMK